MLTPFRLMDSLINQMFGGDNPLRRLESFFPLVDVAEQDGKLIIRADLPGMDVDDVRVIMTDDAITIEGEREDERERDDTRMYRYERTYGRFHREISLPEGVGTENVNATFKNGVLEINLDMPEASQAQREIPIQASESRDTGKQGKSKQSDEKAA